MKEEDYFFLACCVQYAALYGGTGLFCRDFLKWRGGGNERVTFDKG